MVDVLCAFSIKYISLLSYSGAEDIGSCCTCKSGFCCHPGKSPFLRTSVVQDNRVNLMEMDHFGPWWVFLINPSKAERAKVIK